MTEGSWWSLWVFIWQNSHWNQWLQKCCLFQVLLFIFHLFVHSIMYSHFLMSIFSFFLIFSEFIHLLFILLFTHFFHLFAHSFICSFILHFIFIYFSIYQFIHSFFPFRKVWVFKRNFNNCCHATDTPCFYKSIQSKSSSGKLDSLIYKYRDIAFKHHRKMIIIAVRI